MAQVLTQHHVAVDSAGEHVTLAIGNWRRELHYETALLLAHWIVTRGHEAKAASGDKSTGYGVAAALTIKGQSDEPFDPLRVPVVARDMIATHDIEVTQQGSMVVLRFGHSTIRIPYAAAFTIAQWIRVRAKEAKARAGDTARHWSKIVEAHDPAVTRG